MNVHIKSDERKSHESYVLESFGKSRGGAVTYADRDAAEVIAARSREAYQKLRGTEGKHNGRF